MHEVEAKRLELQQHEQDDAEEWRTLRADTQMHEARNRVGRKLMSLRRYRDALKKAGFCNARTDILNYLYRH